MARPLKACETSCMMRCDMTGPAARGKAVELTSLTCSQGLTEDEVQAAAKAAAADAAQASDMLNRTTDAADAQERCDAHSILATARTAATRSMHGSNDSLIVSLASASALSRDQEFH